MTYLNFSLLGEVIQILRVSFLEGIVRIHTNWFQRQVKAEYSIFRAFYHLADQRGLDVPISERMRLNLAQEFDFHGLNTPYESAVWIPNDLLGTAALVQHYGIPTRLLDWTYDIFVALYFAFTGAIEKQGKLEIWALNKEYISFLKPTINRVNIDFITPHYANNPNLNAQKGPLLIGLFKCLH